MTEKAQDGLYVPNMAARILSIPQALVDLLSAY
jgi:hypothetical protein